MSITATTRLYFHDALFLSANLSHSARARCRLSQIEHKYAGRLPSARQCHPQNYKTLLMISFVLIVNKQSQTRFSKYNYPCQIPFDQQSSFELQLSRECIQREGRQVSFMVVVFSSSDEFTHIFVSHQASLSWVY